MAKVKSRKASKAKSQKRSPKRKKALALKIHELESGQYHIAELSTGHISYDPEKITIEIDEDGGVTYTCR